MNKAYRGWLKAKMLSTLQRKLHCAREFAIWPGCSPWLDNYMANWVYVDTNFTLQRMSNHLRRNLKKQHFACIWLDDESQSFTSFTNIGANSLAKWKVYLPLVNKPHRVYLPQAIEPNMNPGHFLLPLLPLWVIYNSSPWTQQFIAMDHPL